MKRTIDTGIPTVGAPFEWAVTAGGALYTAQIPISADGAIETGGTMADVTQVMIYLGDAEVFAAMNEVYKEYFVEPYPNRATVVVGLLEPDMKIEMLVRAHIER
jgi:2-iminobutanoate/2-iminopropanoate deaminase